MWTFNNVYWKFVFKYLLCEDNTLVIAYYRYWNINNLLTVFDDSYYSLLPVFENIHYSLLPVLENIDYSLLPVFENRLKIKHCYIMTIKTLTVRWSFMNDRSVLSGGAVIVPVIMNFPAKFSYCGTFFSSRKASVSIWQLSPLAQLPLWLFEIRLT